MEDTLQGLLTQMDAAREAMLVCVTRAKAAEGMDVDGTVCGQVSADDPMSYQLVCSLLAAQETYRRVLAKVLQQLQPTTPILAREVWAKEHCPDAVARLDELKTELLRVQPKSRRYYAARHELECISLTLNIAWCKHHNATTPT